MTDVFTIEQPKKESEPIPTELVLQVSVRDRTGILYEGTAEAVSSYNAKGLFDILPLHANFISLISQSLTIHLAERVRKEIPIESGVLVVAKNRVAVYLGILR